MRRVLSILHQCVDSWKSAPLKTTVWYLGVVAIVWCIRWTVLHRGDPELWPTVVGFSVAWIPFAFSVWLALVTDLKGKHPALTGTIIVATFVWSLLAWQDKRESLESARKQQEAVMDGLDKVGERENKTDDRVKDLAGQVGMVRDDLKAATGHSDDQISSVRTDLKGAVGTFTDLFKKTEDDLNASIGKMGKPDPPELARLVFAYQSTDVTNFPILLKVVQLDKQRAFSLDFMARNTAQVRLKNGQLWVQVCQLCKFSKEPEGFIKPNGTDEHVRLKNFGDLNGGIFTEKMTVDVVIPESIGVGTSVLTSFDWACENCVAHPAWDQTLISLIK